MYVLRKLCCSSTNRKTPKARTSSPALMILTRLLSPSTGNVAMKTQPGAGHPQSTGTTKWSAMLRAVDVIKSFRASTLIAAGLFGLKPARRCGSRRAMFLTRKPIQTSRSLYCWNHKSGSRLHPRPFGIPSTMSTCHHRSAG